MQTVLYFHGTLSELLLEVQSKFPYIDWSIHESDVYFTGRYILGRLGTTKITMEVLEEGVRYEVAIC